MRAICYGVWKYEYTCLCTTSQLLRQRLADVPSTMRIRFGPCAVPLTPVMAGFEDELHHTFIAL